MRAIYAWSAAALVVAVFGVGSSFASAKSDTSNKCAVTVDRSMAADLFQVTRQRMDNGDCVCHVTTGPQTQSSSVEELIANLQASGKCGTTPAAAVGDGSAKKFPWIIIGGAAGVGGIIAAAASGGSDSTGG